MMCMFIFTHFSHRHQDSFVCNLCGKKILRGIPLHGTSSSRESTRGTKKVGRSPLHIFFSLVHHDSDDSGPFDFDADILILFVSMESMVRTGCT